MKYFDFQKQDEIISELRMQNEKREGVNDDPLEKRVQKLEELSKFKTLRTCQELANRGISMSGESFYGLL